MALFILGHDHGHPEGRISFESFAINAGLQGCGNNVVNKFDHPIDLSHCVDPGQLHGILS